MSPEARRSGIRLVVNADDLGLHPAIDAGILRAHREGIVTSATVLVTGPSAPEAVKAAKAQGLSLGVHLALSTGLRPASPAHSLPTLAPEGRFRASWSKVVQAWVSAKLSLPEVDRELRAQVRLARELGIEIDHLDSHQHLHLLPGLRPLIVGLARELKLPLRWPGERPHANWLRYPGPALKSGVLNLLALVKPPPQRLAAVGLLESGVLNEAALLALLGRLKTGDWELCCHPGSKEVQVPEDPSWRYGWTDELAALTSSRVRSKLQEQGIHLTTYRELFSQ